MRHRATRPVLDPVRRYASALASRRGISLAVPVVALAVAAGGGVTALDHVSDPDEGDTTRAAGAVNRAGAFAQASGKITGEPTHQSREASPASSRSSEPAADAANPSDSRTAASGTTRAHGAASSSPESTDTAAPSGGQSSSQSGTSDSAPTPQASSDGSTPAGPSGSPSGGASTGSPASPSPSSDGTPPQTSIDAGPVDDLPTAFTFSANEPATFECSLDGAGWESCASGLSLPDLGAGWHTLAVRATDRAGNVDGSPAEWTWHTTGR